MARSGRGPARGQEKSQGGLDSKRKTNLEIPLAVRKVSAVVQG